MSAQIHIGTSGFSYKHWRNVFYPSDMPERRWLEFYAEKFSTVELNNPFYRLPTRTQFESWKERTPKHFQFSVKMSRYLTHNKKLLEPQEPLERFISVATGLGKKLGPILFQLPPNFSLHLERFEKLLRELPKHRCTFEFREHSWLCEEVYALLKKYNCALCIYDIAGFETPHVLTADWTYIRLHGPSIFKYHGSYNERALKRWAAEINAWREKLKAIYIYFDNDPLGHAPKNARTLIELLRQ